MAPVMLSELTSPEAGESLQKARLALIPTGSNEQHGPHIALCCDIACATAIARQAAERLAPRVVVAPPIPWGVSPHHMGFPGTISLRPSTFIAILRDVVASLRRHGLSRFLIVNGHGGNAAALDTALWELREEMGVSVAHSSIFELASDVIKDGAGEGDYGHACQVETSYALHLVPQIVRREKLPAPRPVGPRYRHAERRAPTPVHLPEDWGAFTEHGALGDPRRANEKFGQQITEAAVGRFVEFAEDFLKGA